MTMNRRQFQQLALGALAAAPLHVRAAGKATPLRILILGGTQFIGVHMVREALRRGHAVTLFNRGRTNAELFPELEKLRGDRDGQLDALRGREWDCVIDDSGYIPRHVQLSTALLAPQARQYLFISSMSAYANFKQPNDENSPLGVLQDFTTEQIRGDTYGPFKAVCEGIVREAFPGRSIVLRPGFVVGPEDPSGRFTWWLANAARGGQIVVPGSPQVAVQFVDARDLARFSLDLLQRQMSGTWNVVSPPGRFSMGPFIAADVASARRHARPASPPRAVWMPQSFIEGHGVVPALAFPLWPGNRDEPALAQVSATRALAAGLHNTALKKTVDDTMAWLVARPEARQKALEGGLSDSQQQSLLAAWAKERGSQP